jgi:hypothetical protein
VTELAVIRDGPPQIIADAMAALRDPETPIQDRAAIYGVLAVMVREMNKAMGTYIRSGPTAKSELIAHLTAQGLEELGPLYIKWEAFDVAYPCNAAENWTDSGVQDAMAAMRGNPETSDYIRAIPAHLEIDVMALGQAVHDGSATARALFAELKDKGWRTEAGRRAALKVREPRRKAA